MTKVLKKKAARWVKGLRPEMPIWTAARTVLKARFDAVVVLLKAAARYADRDPEFVHQLRVATRRAATAVSAFEPHLDPDAADTALRHLRKIRRAAASARDCDVHVGLLRREREAAPIDARPVYDHVIAVTIRERVEAQVRIRRAARRFDARRLRSTRRALAAKPDEDSSSATTGLDLSRASTGVPCASDAAIGFAGRVGRKGGGGSLLDLAEQALEAKLHEFIRAAEADLSVIENVHDMRLCGKRLRYTIELFGPCLDRRLSKAVQQDVEALQERLGGLNDTSQVVLRFERVLSDLDSAIGAESGVAAASTPLIRLREGLACLLERARTQLSKCHSEFIESWNRGGGGAATSLTEDLRLLLEACRQAVAPPRAADIVVRTRSPEAVVPRKAATPTEPPVHQHRARSVETEAAVAPTSDARPHTDSGNESDVHAPRRIAAIDVGTNSIRLIIAEATPDGAYRVLDDEKEIARLGRGLDSTGRLDADAMELAAVTVQRMRIIAEGYGVAMLRAVGTAAVREAANREQFVELLRARAGVELQVISAQEEAKLAFLSAGNAIDLSTSRAAVIDIGGGSTEIVLAAPGPAGSVIEHIYTIPLGAVRLTERHGGAEAAGGSDFRAMKRSIRRELKQRIGSPHFVPQVLVGTGGTITALAAMAIHAELGPAADGLFGGSVQGHEVRRWEVKHLLEYLRKLPVRDRARVPGLSPDRADIIVAGLALVDASMKALGVDRIKVHEGGIRDGILLTMVHEAFGRPLPGTSDAAAASEQRDPLRSVRRFARACGYEHRHCNHVADLCVQIFDQLATAVGSAEPEIFSDRSRVLLQAAAYVHDVGYLINYARHHKHSYHLIVHADLPGFSAREVEIIANLARYHRRAEPKGRHRAFAKLSKDDRRLVRGLAAILRVADGLDRTHMQRVRSVDLQVHAADAVFRITSPDEPTVDAWGAQRKGGLFAKVFGIEPRFEWIRIEPSAADQPPLNLPQSEPSVG